MTWVKDSYSLKDITLELRSRVNHQSGECHCREHQECRKQLHDKALTRYYELTCPDKIAAVADSAANPPSDAHDVNRAYAIHFRNGSSYSMGRLELGGVRFEDGFDAVWSNATAEANIMRKWFYATQTLYNRIAWIIMVTAPYRRN